LAEEATGISLRQMQIFLAAMESRSFIRAAEKLSLSPPAVSMQMSRLSEALGAPLFERDGRSVRATQVAIALVPYAERLTETLRDAVQMVESLQGRIDRQVRIAMVTTARNFGPQLVHRFQVRCPEAAVEMHIANREGVIALLQEGRADIALMGRPPRRIRVVAQPFAIHPYVLICHPEHPLRQFRRIRPEDLAVCRFLVREPGSGTRMVHEHFFKDAGLPLPQAQEMDSNANIMQAVMADMGLAFISAHTVALERAAGKLHLLQVDGMPQLRDWYVVYPSGRPLRPSAARLADFVARDGPGFMKAFYGEDLGAT
jgi:DNA-binding transcriptional LysR family regulator